MKKSYFDFRFKWLLFKIRIDRKVDRFYQILAWHLPEKLISWAGTRLLAYATQGEYSDTVVPELDIMTALNRWDCDKLWKVKKYE